MPAPKLFISYCWSSPDHQQWVISLAESLVESGVDVILDKWDLKEGHDAIAFMEQMVTNPEIGKVLIVCDKKYADKADGRDGGVGTETQIISKKVYEKRDQGKFVAVLSEKDDDGKPYLPTYYTARIYIDLSEADTYAQNFEQLLRWIFDKPLYVKPTLGNPPSFLSDSDHVPLGTTALYKRCVDAFKNNRIFAAGAFAEYCSTFVANLDRFRLSKTDGAFDDAVINSIEDFITYRNEIIQLLITISQYSTNSEIFSQVHRFFENLIPYMDRPLNVSSWREWDFDNYRFIVHELFLYALAVLLKYERFGEAAMLLNQQYYLHNDEATSRVAMVGFDFFYRNMSSLEYRKQRTGSRQYSLRADLLEERCNNSGIELRYLLQADFIAFLRSDITDTGQWNTWWPVTLIYLGRTNNPFELFARASSKTYFDKLKVVLGINTPQDLESLLSAYTTGKKPVPSWDFVRINPSILIGYDQLATRP